MLKILGSSSQLPTRNRNHNAFFLRWDDFGLLIDPGEGTQRQMLCFNVPPSAVDAIFISHFHGDHCLGLPGVLQRLSLSNLQHPIKVWYPAAGQDYFDRLRYCSAFYDNLQVEVLPLAKEGVVFADQRFTITVRKLDHTEECWGFRLDEPDGYTLRPERLEERGVEGPDRRRLVEEGFVATNAGTVRLEEVSVIRRGQRFTYIADTAVCPAIKKLAQDVDLLLCEATYLESELELAYEYRHLTARQAGELARSAGVGQLILTHFSQRYTEVEGHLAEASAVFPNVIAGFDGLDFSFPHRRRGLV